MIGLRRLGLDADVEIRKRGSTGRSDAAACPPDTRRLAVLWTRRPISCPHCGSMRLRKKDRYVREVRHESWGQRHCVLVLDACKFRCRDCLRYFRQRVPGLLPCQRATEPFRRSIFLRHWDGISRRRLGQREGIGLKPPTVRLLRLGNLHSGGTEIVSPYDERKKSAYQA